MDEAHFWHPSAPISLGPLLSRRVTPGVFRTSVKSRPSALASGQVRSRRFAGVIR
jgi:hypothetical protein